MKSNNRDFLFEGGTSLLKHRACARTQRSRVCRAAKEREEEGAQLLHAVCWKAAIEGNVEPIYWQGQIVGEVRRYDSQAATGAGKSALWRIRKLWKSANRHASEFLSNLRN
jgi:hypothetical protein